MQITDHFHPRVDRPRRPTLRPEKPLDSARLGDEKCPTGLSLRGRTGGLLNQSRALGERLSTDLGGGPASAPAARHLEEFRQGLCPYLKQVSEGNNSALDLLRQQLEEYKMDPVDFFVEAAAQMGPSFQAGKVHFEGRPEVAQMVLVNTDRKAGEGFSKSPLQANALGSMLGHDNIFLIGGQPWEERRAMMQPFFSGAEVMNEETHSHVLATVSKHLDTLPVDGEPLDLDPRLRMMTLDAALQHMFGAELSMQELAEAVKLFAQVGASAADQILGRGQTPSPELDELASLILGRGKPQGNLLQALQESSMDEQALRKEVLTMALLGHETTANLLNWSLAELTRNPEDLQAVQGEVRALLGSGPPSLEQTRKLKGAAEIVRETARVHPPNYLLVREAPQDITLETKLGPVSFEAGTQVLMPLNVINATADGNAWDPQREGAKFYSFGSGSRVCLGQVFARLECSVILSQLLHRFDLEAVSQTMPKPLSAFSSGPSDNRYRLQLSEGGIKSDAYSTER